MTTRRRAIAAAALAASGLAAAPAAAGTVSGTITVQAGGAPLAGAEVRIWREGTKGYAIHQTTAADGAGNYSFDVVAGNYLVDARGPAGSGTNYGDRWYDDAAPNSGGYVGESADVLAVTASSAHTGIGIAMEVLGGSDGTVQRAGAQPATNMWVRMERRGEVRIHHNDFTDPPTGLMSFRGMPPANDYQLMVYDPTGVQDLLLVPGPFTVVSNVNGTLPTVTMNATPADPNEGNNAASCSASSINAAALHADPPQPWSSTGARIGPLAAADVDWFCFTAVAGDRLFFTATTELTFAGATRRHPWADPLMAFWRGAGVTKLAENDDGGGGYDARLDTGPLTAGCHCASITTFGDPDYNGSGQTSTGPYQLRVVMGNRPPVPSIRKGNTEVPAAPATFSIDEGDTLELTLSYIDADHDTPTRGFTHVDSGGNAVAGGTLVLNADTGSYTWVAPPDAATGSPYTLRLQAADGEFDMSKTVTLVVNAVDMPPPVPVLVAPVDGAVVATGAPPLVWNNAADPDGDPVTYDLEIYGDDVNAPPLETATAIAEGAGTTTFTPTTIPENTRVFWRVRARTAAVGGLSPWSEYHRFLVDTANDPPDVPVLIKPADGELVAMRRPGLSVLNVADPEDDAVGFWFEIARDAAFTEIVWSSAAVAQNTVSATTMTGTDVDLAWGGEYHARVRARDARGGESDWSDPHRFRLKNNLPPGTPAWDAACVASTYTDTAPDSLTVRNVEDPEGELVLFEVELFRFEDDPLASFPVYMTTAPMNAAATTTAIPIDLSGVANRRYRYFVRASDGTDASGAIECELTLDLPSPGDAAGGCCSTGSPDPRAVAGLVVVVFAALLRRRRVSRRASAGT